MAMSKAMICRGCEVGILPGDVIFHCKRCKRGGLSYCESCYAPSRACGHGMKRVKLEDDKLPVRDKDGSLGLGLKCYKCKTKMVKKEICFKCNSCWDPDLCASCWRQPGKRCKHAGKGKVKMCKVGRKGDDDEMADVVDGIISVFIG
ncbi:hypothetical protein HRG_010566 [Hirsutella rhossiliensis]|uniref:Uncharacterized protein n=1 Tax=Hirsutella rhossiliensis TaxID=111463 RepID=A0A9P8SEC9_9HYPO|nr:uncharacterized protein HRG_10566 [Hirsutella rhossiliensis]KAH0958265.1 hypothetical protein HRG_10566 [Hirsutella rhossiliensis]